MVGPKKARFLAKNQPTQRIFFLNPSMNYGSSKSAKIVLSKSIFDVKNQLIFFQKKIRLRPNILSKRLGGRPKPKPMNEKLQLRPINQLIGRPLPFYTNIIIVSLQNKFEGFPTSFFF